MYIYRTTFNNTNIMKKLFLITLGLILALAACSKTEYLQSQNDNESTPAVMSLNSGIVSSNTPDFDKISRHLDSLMNVMEPSSSFFDLGFIYVYPPDEPGGTVGIALVPSKTPISDTIFVHPRTYEMGINCKDFGGKEIAVICDTVPYELILDDYYYLLDYWDEWDYSYSDNTGTYTRGVFQGKNPFILKLKAQEVKIFKPVLVKRPKPKYLITIISADTTQGSVSGSVQHGVGTLFDVNVTPAAGYEFDRWEISGGQDVSGTKEPINITPLEDGVSFIASLKQRTNDVCMKAHFKSVNKVAVNVMAADNNGTVSGGGTFALNQSFTINAIPKEGYKFDHWEKNGVSVPGAGASYTTSASDNTPLTFKAFFTAKTLASIFFENTEGGHVTGTQGTKYVGEPFTITAVPDNGYQFSHWTKNGVIINGAGASYTTTVQNSSSVTFKAHFTAMSQKVNVTFNCFVENSYYNNQTYIEYYNPQGILETISPDLLSNQIEIRKGTSITVYINISKPGEQIYCIFSTQDGEYYDLSALDLVSSTKTIENINEDFEITLQADNSDFR